MVAYNFQPRFAALVESGSKTQTIRRHRINRHARPGEEVQLYTGMRTPDCRLLARGVCVDTAEVCISLKSNVLSLAPLAGDDGATERCETPASLDEFARADGFASWSEMQAWFSDQYGANDPNAFIGVLIRWRIAKAEG